MLSKPSSFHQNKTQAPSYPVKKREILAWAFFDFANSGYTTVVLTAIYSAYFVAVIAKSNAYFEAGSATFVWTLCIGIANFLVLLSAPMIGAISDYRGNKKQFLLASTVGCVLFTALLAVPDENSLTLSCTFLIISAMCFSYGENLIAAFLPEISNEKNIGKISGYGWSLGYFGGLLTLGVCLAYLFWAREHNIPDTQSIPRTLYITALMFTITALPTFLWLKERATPSALPKSPFSYLSIGFTKVLATLKDSTHHQDLFRFLLCLTVYQSGVAAVIVLAAIYAQEVIGFNSQQLIVLIMIVNLTAAIGAFLFGLLQDKLGSVKSLALSLMLWIVAMFLTLVSSDASTFWVAANLIGFAMGASQSGGRALIGQLTPVQNSGEFFGLWGFANRLAAIIGPMSYGVINYLTQGNHKASLVSTLIFFIVGLALLFRVNVRRGIDAAILK
ncbi:MAG: MFS transporter [Pseudomonadales bacterium]|nr:MFS transporter [Pseudomonadales bacterium]